MQKLPLFRDFYVLVLVAFDGGGGGEAGVVPTSRSALNPFLFIRGLSCPSNVQTSLTQNCANYIPGFPYNCLSDIGYFLKILGLVVA
jgi:hypothetical protein